MSTGVHTCSRLSRSNVCMHACRQVLGVECGAGRPEMKAGIDQADHISSLGKRTLLAPFLRKLGVVPQQKLFAVQALQAHAVPAGGRAAQMHDQSVQAVQSVDPSRHHIRDYKVLDVQHCWIHHLLPALDLDHVVALQVQRGVSVAERMLLACRLGCSLLIWQECINSWQVSM